MLLNIFKYYVFPQNCCADIQSALDSSRYDFQRFGCEPTLDPAQADLLIVSGYFNDAMGALVKTVYGQMAESKRVMAVGACSVSGGWFQNQKSQPSSDGVAIGNLTSNTHTTQSEGVDRWIPVDVFVPGCPPRPEALMYGFLKMLMASSGRAF